MNVWQEKIHPIFTYNPKGRSYEEFHDNVELTNKLSHMTNCLLNSCVNLIDKKNVIIASPDIILRPIPLIAYFYSFLNKKTTLVFTQNNGHVDENPLEIHKRNYYLLNNEYYIFNEVPLGIVSNKKIESKLYLPRVSDRDLKRRYIQQQEINFSDNEKPKILLYHDNKSSKVIESINNVVLDSGNLDKSIKMELGCIIFENMDRFVYSDYTYRYFLKWIKELLNQNVNLIFHFSNPYSKFINEIKESTNSVVLSSDLNLLNNNNEIKNESLKYFNSEENIPIIKFLNKYNLDLPNFYEDNEKIINVPKPLLKSGNIDYHYKSAIYLLNKLNKTKLRNKWCCYTPHKLLNELPNLTVNPSKYKCVYWNNDLKHYPIDSILKYLSSSILNENNKNRMILDSLISEIYAIYFELSQVDRFSEKGVYTRIAKDYKILEIAENINFKEDDVIFATYSPNEKTILAEDFKKNNLNSIEIEDINWLSQKDFDRTQTTLILPGPLPPKNLVELFLPYKEIIFLAYEGVNYEKIKVQIELINNYSFESEKLSMQYMEEIYDLLNVNKNNAFFNDFNLRKKKYYDNQKISPDTILNEKNPFEIVKNQLFKKAPFSNKYYEQIEHVEKMINSINQEDLEKDMDEGEYIEVNLKNLSDNKQYIKKLPVIKTYLTLKSRGSQIKEITPQNLRSGNYVVILDNDEKKTLLQLIIDLFGLEEDINKLIVEYWKNALAKYFNGNKLTYKSIYDQYEDLGGQKDYQTIRSWIKGEVLGPDNPIDLLYIGKILKDDIIIENYKLMMNEINKVRSIHRTNGRKLMQTIKSIIFEGDRLQPHNLNYEESLFYETVENGIYEVIEIVN